MLPSSTPCSASTVAHAVFGEAFKSRSCCWRRGSARRCRPRVLWRCWGQRLRRTSQAPRAVTGGGEHRSSVLRGTRASISPRPSASSRSLVGREPVHIGQAGGSTTSSPGDRRHVRRGRLRLLCSGTRVARRGQRGHRRRPVFGGRRKRRGDDRAGRAALPVAGVVREGFRGHRSTSTQSPCPTPTHSVARPRPPPSSTRVFTSVVTMRAPEQPSG